MQHSHTANQPPGAALQLLPFPHFPTNYSLILGCSPCPAIPTLCGYILHSPPRPRTSLSVFLERSEARSTYEVR